MGTWALQTKKAGCTFDLYAGIHAEYTYKMLGTLDDCVTSTCETRAGGEFRKSFAIKLLQLGVLRMDE